MPLAMCRADVSWSTKLARCDRVVVRGLDVCVVHLAESVLVSRVLAEVEAHEPATLLQVTSALADVEEGLVVKVVNALVGRSLDRHESRYGVTFTRRGR